MNLSLARLAALFSVIASYLYVSRRGALHWQHKVLLYAISLTLSFVVIMILLTALQRLIGGFLIF